MGKGLDACRLDAPEHVEMLENLKEQLLIVFLRRLGRTASIPVSEIDDTGQELLAFRIDANKVFHFELRKKQ